MEKKYTIIYRYDHGYDGRIEKTGTLDELTEWASYDLLCGNSRDGRINRHPKTAAGLVSALNKSATACHRYNDYYYLKK